MLFRFVEIKGIPIKIIKINGKWYYKHHICLCGCGGRIPYPTNKYTIAYQKYNGIPDYIFNHHPKSSQFKKGHKLNCGSKRTEEQKKKQSKALTGKPKSKEACKNMSEAQKKYIRENPGKVAERIQKMCEASQDFFQDNPDKRIEQMKNMRKAIKKVSKPELKMLKYVDELNIQHFPSKKQDGQVDGTPDTIIPTTDCHPIALFEDGCYFHGCLECFPIDEVSHEKWKFQSERREYDRIINKKLIKQGFRVIRIWQHDVDNGRYKKIIKRLIADIKAQDDYKGKRE
ncbi:MAG: hypothetical protein Q7J35_03140 [Candidatus Methanoperedens sp.]|nr:hypothetical protein [Candidatus Methanoperedens sp.]